jgi:hypothetical protein
MTKLRQFWSGGKLRFIVVALLGILFITASHFVIEAPDVTQKGGLIKILLHEAGFALIVALVIYMMFEYFSQVESEEQWNERIERIAKSVFFGVFRRNFPPELIQEANVLLLEQTFIRLGFHVTYTLNDDVVHDEKGAPSNFVRMEAVARSRIRNISNAAANCPISIGLPNPLQENLKQKCCVNRVVVRRKGVVENINQQTAEAKFREQLRDNSSHIARFVLEPVNIGPGEEIEVTWDYVMAKEEEDTEIGQTIYPADSVIITVMDTKPERRIVRARSIHPAPLENDTSAEAKGTYIFRLERYLLPHQGFAIWWKRRQPEAVQPLGVGTKPAESG